MTKLKPISITTLILLILTFTTTATPDSNNLGKHFKNFKGTFVILNQHTGTQTIHNQKRAATQFTPCSTFKIPNSIIALETKVVPNITETLSYNRQKYPAQDWWPNAWKKDHNLKFAIKYSAVPIYRQIATQIGSERMKYYLNSFNYGNKDISSGIDNFWLTGSIKISALEQIRFLKNFHNHKLNVSQKTINAVKSILILESTEHYVLSGKTGGGYLDKETAIGWLVGYVEKNNNVWFFAMNIEGKSFREIQKPRIQITKAILKELGII